MANMDLGETMAKLKNKEEMQRYKKYHVPSCGNLTSIKLNAVFPRKNSPQHENGKWNTAFEIFQLGGNFITEAERKAENWEIKAFNLKNGKKIVDVVDLSSGYEFEIVHEHESDEQIKLYRENGRIPVIVGDKITCEVCKKEYPRRNKGNICQNCK